MGVDLWKLFEFRLKMFWFVLSVGPTPVWNVVGWHSSFWSYIGIIHSIVVNSVNRHFQFYFLKKGFLYKLIRRHSIENIIKESWSNLPIVPDYKVWNLIKSNQSTLPYLIKPSVLKSTKLTKIIDRPEAQIFLVLILFIFWRTGTGWEWQSLAGHQEAETWGL